MSKNSLLYLAHTSPKIVDETIFSILSALRFLSAQDKATFKVTIYTDLAERFRAFFGKQMQYIDIVPLTKELIATYQGEIKYFHRVKMKCIEHFLINNDGKMIFIDSDTVFLKNPMPLFDRIDSANTLMHYNEGSVSFRNELIKIRLHRFLKRNQVPLFSKLQFIDTHKPIWNSGVLGLQKSYLPYVQEALKLSDHLFVKTGRHMVEQYAFALVLDEVSQIAATDKTVYHYWGFREFNQHIFKFLEEVKTIDNVDFDKLPDPLPLRPPEFTKWSRRLRQAIRDRI